MWPFSRKRRQSMVLIHIGSASVAGAYAHFEEGSPVQLYYSTRVSIEARTEETLEAATLRTLDVVGTALIEKGAPVLRRETGSGQVDGVLVSVGTPWQESMIRTETIQPGRPFIVTKQILSEAVASSTRSPEGRASVGESIIATILNGYDIPEALGKTANRAEIVILSSTLPKTLAEEIRSRLRRLYHTHTITFTAFAPIAYAVLRDLYPHERNFLMLEASGEGSDLGFVKEGLLVDVKHTPIGTAKLLAHAGSPERISEGEETHSSQPGYVRSKKDTPRSIWLASITDFVREFARTHTMPRKLFILTDTSSRIYVRQTLDAPQFQGLWSADDALSVISVTPEQFSSRVRVRAEAQGDVFLSLMAVHAQKQLVR